jgi:hypothetical protein
MRIIDTDDLQSSQAGVTPLERRSEVAPKRGRPPKKAQPAAAANADLLLDSASETVNKRQALDAEALDASALPGDGPVHGSSEDEHVMPQILQPNLAGNDDLEHTGRISEPSQ